MKKQLICVMAAATMLAAAPTALAADVSYKPGTANSVEVNAEGKKTVLITASDNTIVYVDQASDVFTAAEDFKLKNGIDDGKYTVKLGSDTGDAVEKVFYIGMTDAEKDIKLEQPTSGATAENTDGTQNIGYMAGNINGTYSNLIVKMNGNYYGMALGTTLTFTNGGAIGIQINNVASDESIEGVWLSNRDYATK